MLAKRGSAVKERVSNHCPYGSFNQSQASLVRTDQRAIFAFGLSSLGLFLVWACHSGLCEISPRTGQFFSISGIDKRSSNSISENTRPADYFFFLPAVCQAVRYIWLVLKTVSLLQSSTKFVRYFSERILFKR
jgi:hypothetical protein